MSVVKKLFYLAIVMLILKIMNIKKKRNNVKQILIKLMIIQKHFMVLMYIIVVWVQQEAKLDQKIFVE